eukprot:141660_1
MGFWNKVWGGIKRAGKSFYRTVKRAAKSCYRTIKRTASTVWNGIKTGYRTVKGWLGKATEWTIDKVKQFGNWTRRQLNKTWIGRQCVKGWDFTVGGGYKAEVEKLRKKARNFLSKSTFGRGLLDVYDGCASVVNKVMDKYSEVKNWCKSRLENMGFVGEVLSDALSVGTDYILPSVATGGLGKVINIVNKIKSAGNAQLTFLVDQMPFVKKLNSMKSKMGDKMNSVLQNPRIAKFYNEIKDRYNKVDDYLCEKLDDIEHFVEHNTVASVADKLTDKLKQTYNNFDGYLIEQVQKDEVNPVSYGDYLKQKWEDENMKVCCICSEKAAKKELIALDCCGLSLHDQCFRDLVSSKAIKPGNKISLRSLRCISCKKRMKYNAANNILEPLNSVYDSICSIAVNKLSSDNRNNDKELIEEKSEFYGDPMGYAMKLYSLYACNACTKPYVEDKSSDSDLGQQHLCSSCQHKHDLAMAFSNVADITASVTNGNSEDVMSLIADVFDL